MANTITKFLSENSALIPSNVESARVAEVTAKTQRRPDLAFGATASMKWAMILAGIDSPYMLDKGVVVPVPDSADLNSELLELKDFEL